MKINFDKKTFFQKLSFLHNGMPKNPLIPTDGWFYAKISPTGDVSMKISNSEVEMETYMKVSTDKIVEDIEVCFPGSLFFRTITNIDEGEIQMNFQLNDKDQVKSVTIKPMASKNKRYKIAVVANYTDFSHWPELKDQLIQKEFSLNTGLFKESVIAAASNISAKEDMRPSFDNLNMYSYNEKLYINGCSEFTQCFVESDIDFDIQKIVNKKIPTYISTLVDDTTSSIEITETRFNISCGSEKIKTTIFGNKTNNFGQLLDMAPEHYFNVDRLELLNSIKTLIIFNLETVASINTEAGQMTIVAKSTGGVSEGEDIIDIDNPNNVEVDHNFKLKNFQKILGLMKHSEFVSVGISKQSYIYIRNNAGEGNPKQLWMVSPMKF